VNTRVPPITRACARLGPRAFRRATSSRPNVISYERIDDPLQAPALSDSALYRCWHRDLSYDCESRMIHHPDAQYYEPIHRPRSFARCAVRDLAARLGPFRFSPGGRLGDRTPKKTTGTDLRSGSARTDTDRHGGQRAANRFRASRCACPGGQRAGARAKARGTSRRILPCPRPFSARAVCDQLAQRFASNLASPRLANPSTVA